MVIQTLSGSSHASGWTSNPTVYAATTIVPSSSNNDVIYEFIITLKIRLDLSSYQSYTNNANSYKGLIIGCATPSATLVPGLSLNLDYINYY